MAPMLQPRYENMAACHMGAHIYVIGGLDQHLRTLFTVARYNILTNKWSPIPENLTTFDNCNMAATTVNKRFIFTCGGKNQNAELTRETELFSRLDTLNIKKGWAVLQMKIPNHEGAFDRGFYQLE